MKGKKAITVVALIGTLVFIQSSGLCIPPIQKQAVKIKQKEILSPALEKTKKVTPKLSFPDLYIEDIEVSGSYAIKVIIKNKGDRGLTQEEINKCIISYTPPQGAKVSMFLRLLPGAHNLSSPNGTVEWEIRNVRKDGQYTAEVDTGNNIKESNESNNIFSKFIQKHLLITFSINLSPLGDIHYKGERLNISWTYENAASNQFDIKLLKGGRFVRNIATAVSGDNYDWIIPKDLQPGKYTIRVGLHSDPSIYALLGITIKDVFEEYNFRILSPTSNSRFRPGDTLEIRWQIDPNKYPRINRINLNKVISAGYYRFVTTIAQHLNVDSEEGTFTYTIPDDIEPGRYILCFNLDRLKDHAQSIYDTYLVFIDSEEFVIGEE